LDHVKAETETGESMTSLVTGRRWWWWWWWWWLYAFDFRLETVSFFVFRHLFPLFLYFFKFCYPFIIYGFCLSNCVSV